MDEDAGAAEDAADEAEEDTTTGGTGEPEPEQGRQAQVSAETQTA